MGLVPLRFEVKLRPWHIAAGSLSARDVDAAFQAVNGKTSMCIMVTGSPRLARVAIWGGDGCGKVLAAVALMAAVFPWR